MRLQFFVVMALFSMMLSCSQEPQLPQPSQSSKSSQSSPPVVVGVRIAADGRCFVDNAELACKEVGKTIVAAYPNTDLTVAIESEKAEGDLSALIAPVEQGLSAVGIKDITVATIREAN